MKPKPFKKDKISVTFVADNLSKTVGVALERKNDVKTDDRFVVEANLHRPGLALTGYLDLFTHHRIQILGNTEYSYLAHLDPVARTEAFSHIVYKDIPCIFLTESNELDAELIDLATTAGIPVFSTPLPSTDFMALLNDFLNDQFAMQQSVHGALIGVYGIGLLIIGSPGIGKSEVALDLVERGHRLVADDVVMVTRTSESVLMGSGTDIAKHFMEIRGLGLIDVRAMFGIRAIRFQKRVEVVVHLHPWDPEIEYTRIGMVHSTFDIMGSKLPLVKLPITPGKNVTVLCEVIAMNHLLQHYGYDAAAVFADRLSDRIKAKGIGGPSRGIEYFEHDYE